MPVLFLAFGVLASLWLSWRFSLPVERLIVKAIALSSKKQARELLIDSDEEIFQTTTNEYLELEQAVDRIARKLLKRRVQLAHEREEAQALMSFMNDGVLSVNRDEKIVYFNSYFGVHFLEASQLKQYNESPGLDFSDIFRDPAITEGLRKALDQAVISQFQKKLQTKMDPAGRHFSVTVTPLREEKGGANVYGALLLLHDITDLKTTELMKTEFVENASHELRTPLTVLKGYVAAAIEDANQGRMEQIPHFLGVVSRNVQRLSELVNDLLTLSALEHKTLLKVDLVNPADLTNSVIDQMSKVGLDRRMMFKAYFDCPSFRGDPLLVERVLENLIGNAVKYSHEGGVIEVRWAEDQPNKGVLLSVKDSGPGIGEEHLGRLFERFYRIDKGRSRDVGGTGLGLAIVKHIMQSHGGTVGVRSTIGQGAEFICFFPRGQNDNQKFPAKEAAKNLSSSV